MQYNFSTNEFEDTVNELNIPKLAELYRRAENLHIDNNNGEYHNYNFTGSDMKHLIICYLDANFLIDDRNDFYEIINSMGC